MTSLTLTVEELNQLDALIGNVPTKFGLPIVQFFALVQQKRKLTEQNSLEVKKALELKSNREKWPSLNNGDQEQKHPEQEKEHGDQEQGLNPKNDITDFTRFSS